MQRHCCLYGQHVGIGCCVIMTTHVHGFRTQLPIPYHGSMCEFLTVLVYATALASRESVLEA